MTLHVALTHRTAYHYDRVIGMAPQVIRLRPAPHCRTPILSYSLNIEPKQHFINWQQDPFANYCARVVLLEKTDRFVVTVDLVADMAVINPFDFYVEDGAKDWPFLYDPELKAELGPYLEPLPATPAGQEIPRLDPEQEGRHDRLPHRAQSPGAQRGELLRAPRAGHPDARGDADQGVGLVPRFRLAAGAGAAPHRLCRALRLRLPDPAASRRETARRRRCRRRRRLHRPARLGRGLPSRRRLDRPRSDLRPARRRRPHPAWPRPRNRRARRRSAAPTSRPR